MGRPLAVASGKHWKPKDPVKEETDEWLFEAEMDTLLSKLCGEWQDTKGSSYTLTRNPNGDKLDVATERPNGVIHKTGGLIQVEWDGLYGRVVWGRGGPRRQYTIASFDGKTLRWQRAGSPDFEWERVGKENEIDSDIHEPEVETARNKKSDNAQHRDSRKETHLHRAKLRREFREERRQTETPTKTEIDDVRNEAEEIDGCEAGRQILARLQASKENVQVNSAKSADIITKEEKIDADATEVLLEALKIAPSSKASQQHAPSSQPLACAAGVPLQPLTAMPLQPLTAMLPQMQIFPFPVLPVDAKQVTNQVEYWFSDDNLFRDSYMKSLMNEEGWVYLGSVQSFRRMQQMGVDIWALRFAIIPSTFLELDGSAQYVRIRDQQRRERWASVTPMAYRSLPSMQ
jgi:hypothetical protein